MLAPKAMLVFSIVTAALFTHPFDFSLTTSGPPALLTQYHVTPVLQL